MCGIIGYSGNANAVNELTQNLKKLEYRGYDSAGISVFTDSGILTVKSEGRISNIENIINNQYAHTVSVCGIGHTRWATHGKADSINAHPHCTENVSLVHNGIIENYKQLKAMLESKGCSFVSETDSEVIAVLLDYEYKRDKNPERAIQTVTEQLNGSYACAVLFKDIKNTVYAFKNESPLIFAETNNGNFISSDICAVKQYTDKYFVLNNKEILIMSASETAVFDKNNHKADKKPIKISEEKDVGKGNFAHYMLKEIHDTPEAIKKTLEKYTADGKPNFYNTELTELLKNTDRIFITACGTALNAGKVGKAYFEKYAKIPTYFYIASEFRYYTPMLKKSDCVIFITQSGETADTLACIKKVKELGIKTVAIVNTVNSTAEREADIVLFTNSGREFAVASTKAYSAAVSLLYSLALFAGEIKGEITQKQERDRLEELYNGIPPIISDILANQQKIKNLSKKYANSDNIFFIGRGKDYYTAEESALKLKEISYIHSESYPAGELKHGTIALIEEGTPVFAVACEDSTYDKMLVNINEVKARGARVLLVSNKDSSAEVNTDDTFIIKCPYTDLFPLPNAVFFQLFAYYTAVIKDKDVDKPRNLAKSVTVE